MGVINVENYSHFKIRETVNNLVVCVHMDMVHAFDPDSLVIAFNLFVHLVGGGEIKIVTKQDATVATEHRDFRDTFHFTPV